MTTEGNTSCVQRAIAGWNAGSLDTYLELYDPDVVLHGYAPGLPPGVAGARAFYSGFLAAFPGAQLTIEDMLAEGDRVVVRYAVRGTHGGEFMGIPPSGTEIAMDGLTVLRFAGGRCVERWNQADFLGLLQQLGAIPAPA